MASLDPSVLRNLPLPEVKGEGPDPGGGPHVGGSAAEAAGHVGLLSAPFWDLFFIIFSMRFLIDF